MPASLGLRHIEFPCVVDGCTEKWGIIVDLSGRKNERRARLEAKRQQVIAEQGNFCIKHKHIARVPSPSNPYLTATYVVVMRNIQGRMKKVLAPIEDPVDGRMENTTFGPGYYLYPDELPINARVTFTVEVEVPEEPEGDVVEL